MTTQHAIVTKCVEAIKKEIADAQRRKYWESSKIDAVIMCNCGAIEIESDFAYGWIVCVDSDSGHKLPRLHEAIFNALPDYEPELEHDYDAEPVGRYLDPAFGSWEEVNAMFI